jgi:hypothetical protein
MSRATYWVPLNVNHAARLLAVRLGIGSEKAHKHSQRSVGRSKALALVLIGGDMRKYFAAAIFVAVTIGLISPASASYIVDAKASSIPSPLDTGLILNPGDLYNFSVENPSTLWSAGNGPQYASTADGISLATLGPLLRSSRWC